LVERVSALSRLFDSSYPTLALAVIFIFVACADGGGVFELQVGDCIVPPDATADEGVQLDDVRTVDCSEPHDGEVIAVFDIEGDAYPGDETLFQMAVERCPSAASNYLYPSEESWYDLDDREVACIAVSLFGLEVGDCIDYSGEAATLGQVKRVDCAETHDAKVIGSVGLPEGDFPGDDAIVETASLYCPEETSDYLGPTSDSWEILNDRDILCLQE
jgi:hypothetical protein